MTARWIIDGGTITSRSDGQRHYVSAGQVARLHGLHRDEWERYSDLHDYPPGTVVLGPRSDGEYRQLHGQPPPRASA